jgi:tryptophan synthase beta chain
VSEEGAAARAEGDREASTVAGDAVLERRFGPYGGRYVPETLVPALDELECAWAEARADPDFGAELQSLLRGYAGRPTPLYRAERLSQAVGRTVYLKREDLLHTGAHKLNNALGQALLARRMGKRRVIAETGAGQHGVATATACALLGIECVVYMGREDMRRQKPNVERMGLLGAEVAPVETGARTLKEAVSEAIRDWVANSGDTHYVIGSAVGPAPYPALVRDLQRTIGDEARAQVLEAEGRLPDRVIACVGGGSNAIGTFVAFAGDADVELVGVEAAGEGIDTGRHSAPLSTGARGVLHGAMSAVMQDSEGQILEAHSVSAGLDYPASGPEHAQLRDSGRARYVAVSDEEAVAAFRRLSEVEGIIPALEPAHAVAWLLGAGVEAAAGAHAGGEGTAAGDGAGRGPRSPGLDLLTLSGRGDKDLAEVLGLD